MLPLLNNHFQISSENTSFQATADLSEVLAIIFTRSLWAYDVCVGWGGREGEEEREKGEGGGGWETD